MNKQTKSNDVDINSVEDIPQYVFDAFPWLEQAIQQLINEARIEEHYEIVWLPDEAKFIERQADRIAELAEVEKGNK